MTYAARPPASIAAGVPRPASPLTRTISDEWIRPTSGAEFAATLRPRRSEGLAEFFVRLAALLQDRDASPLKLMVFGSVSAHDAATEAMRRAFRKIDWPVTWVEGASCDEHPIAGVQVFAISGREVQRLILEGRVIGSVFEDGTARQCVLGGFGPGTTTLSKGDQTRETIERVHGVLQQAGFSFADVVRTWFFLDDLLSWYDDFNRVRSQAYHDIHFRTGSLPASTGVSGRNPSGAALAFGAWALQPLALEMSLREVASPAQCPAPAYGSAFSRAVELVSPHGRGVLVSGTASIAPDGATLWAGDARKQIELTMQVVEAILASRGLAFEDVTRAIAYFKNAGDLSVFRGWCRDRGLRSLPVIPVHCDICRDDLLFELEADAWKV